VVSVKSGSGHVAPNLCFCMEWNLRVTLSISVHPVCEMSTHHFSCLSSRYDFNKKRAETHFAELVFLHPVGSTGFIVYSGTSGREMSTHYFLILGGPGAVSIKSMLGHVTSNFCFCSLLDLQVSHCIPRSLGHEMSTNYFLCSGWPSAVSITSAPEHVTLNLCFCIR
jgi:hypothetical protein